MNTNLIIPIISRNFNVELIANDSECYFFSALRSDVWHFVHGIVSESEHGGFHTDFKQWHIPRYVVAESMEQMRLLDGYDPPMFFELVSDLGIALTPDRKVRFSLRAINEGLNENFSKSLEQDIEHLKKARDLVKFNDGHYVLPRSKTVYKNPVIDNSKELIEAIAFERITRNKLDAKKFGIYSAYCTQADFDHNQRVPISEITRLVKNQFSFDPDDVPDDVLDVCMKVQEMFLEKNIWGPGIDLSVDEAVKIFRDAMSKVSDRQSAMYALMIGMHNPSIFLPLAVILEIVPYRKYLDWMTSSLQPDSSDEQYMLGTTSFIELFGSF